MTNGWFIIDGKLKQVNATSLAYIKQASRRPTPFFIIQLALLEARAPNFGLSESVIFLVSDS